MNSLNQRARAVFDRHLELGREQLGALHASHASVGLLKSGKTIRKANNIIRSRLCDALDQVHDEVASSMDQRGRRWKRSMEQVGTALEIACALARVDLEKTWKLAGAERESIRREADELFAESNNFLRERHDAYRNGWTSPRGKPWRERHPNIWGTLAAVGGALLSLVIPTIFDWATEVLS
jgi:hypothetical protein